MVDAVPEIVTTPKPPESKPAHTGSTTLPTEGAKIKAKGVDAIVGDPPEAENAEAALEALAEKHRRPLMELLTLPKGQLHDLFNKEVTPPENRQAIFDAISFYNDKGKDFLEPDINHHIEKEEKVTDPEQLTKRKAELLADLMGKIVELDENKMLPRSDNHDDDMNTMKANLAYVINQNEHLLHSYNQQHMSHTIHALEGMMHQFQKTANTLEEDAEGARRNGKPQH